jgi:hypothetical protein
MFTIKEKISDYVINLTQQLQAINNTIPKKIGFLTRLNGKKMRTILLLEHEKNLVQKHLIEMCALSIECVGNSKSEAQYLVSYSESQQKYQMERRKIYDELSSLCDSTNLPVDKIDILH